MKLVRTEPGEWWQAVQLICKQLAAENPRIKVRAVCVSGQAPSCTPVDREGQPLRPAILWLPQSYFSGRLAGERLGATAEKVSGNTLDSYFGGPKWLWYVQEEPERYRTWKILQANGYILHALTGEIATDPSHAGLCSPCFNLETGCWDLEVCRSIGSRPKNYPPSTQPAR